MIIFAAISIILMCFGIVVTLMRYDFLTGTICIACGGIMIPYLWTSNIIFSLIAGIGCALLFSLLIFLTAGDDL